MANKMHRWVGGTLSPAPDWPPASARSALHHPVVIRATLIFNNHGKQWLSAYYLPDCEDPQQQTIRETFHLVPKKDETVNLLEGELLIGGSDHKLTYGHYTQHYILSSCGFFRERSWYFRSNSGILRNI